MALSFPAQTFNVRWTIVYCAVALGFEVARVGVSLLEERIGLVGLLLLGGAIAFGVGVAFGA